MLAIQMHFIFNQIAHNETYTLTNPLSLMPSMNTEIQRKTPRNALFFGLEEKSCENYKQLKIATLACASP